MGILFALLVFALFVVIAVWVVDLLASSLSLPPKGVQLIKVILLLMAVVWLFQSFLFHAGGFYFRY